MNEYRKNLDPVSGSTHVELGPLPELPLWHTSAHPSRWPFPSEESARKFAEARKAERPDRTVAIVSPSGGRTEL
ncbi:hypothetical protein SEA_REFUGE_70 [Mycobacterium phage Refuge]|uniref:Uncharacterized protein n=1 Tax=Mycobacterium phage Refuge TaxID=2517967 RepID=A0A482JEP0_9CAUD|nr:hypothetical protein KIV61_gp33 [Mycobacterium phage Refuge]QBP31088.1 hypothetical protein SEA_REFUGE_70 [Mycobacterium phage Refuge]